MLCLTQYKMLWLTSEFQWTHPVERMIPETILLPFLAMYPFERIQASLQIPQVVYDFSP